MANLLLPVLPGVALACSGSGHLLGSAATHTDAGLSDGGAAEAGATCSGLGSPIRLPAPAGPTCAPTLAQRAHRFALCLCDSLNTTVRINTDSFDSTGAAIQAPPPAAVGINGDLQSSNVVQVIGSVYVAGAGGIMTSERVVALGSLRAAGPMRTPAPGLIDVAGDAFAGGDIDGVLLVGGTLHVDPRADTSTADISASAIVQEPVSVPPPCDCGPGFADIGAAIGTAVARNDNAVAGISPDRLAAVTASTVLDVPCGSYALTSIDAQQALFFAVHGRALVAVAGDVVLRAGFTVTLDPGAELDLLIGGRLLASGGNPIGSVTPPRFRIWIAGSQSIVLDDDPTVGALIHAPQAVVTSSAGLELSGALLARSVAGGGTFNLHYDQATLSAGGACGEPAATAVP